VAAATLLALPPTLLLAFFGVNARQVNQANSMFDLHAYWGAYLLAWLPFIALVAAGSLAYARLRERRRPGGVPPGPGRMQVTARDQRLDADG
jgi:nitrate reductase gamma subunit